MERTSSNEAKQFNERRFTKVDMFKKERSTAFMLNFLPNQEVKPHQHPGQELYLHVMEGSGTISIDGEETKVTTGDVIFCEPQEKMGFVNTSTRNVSIYSILYKI